MDEVDSTGLVFAQRPASTSPKPARPLPRFTEAGWVLWHGRGRFRAAQRPQSQGCGLGNGRSPFLRKQVRRGRPKATGHFCKSESLAGL